MGSEYQCGHPLGETKVTVDKISAALRPPPLPPTHTHTCIPVLDVLSYSCKERHVLPIQEALPLRDCDTAVSAKKPVRTKKKAC